MAIPTSRTKKAAEISVDPEKCNGCGLCVAVCKDYSLELKNGRVHVSNHSLFGCIGCGHCMAICPSAAISIHGRTLSPDDLLELPTRQGNPSYGSLHNLLTRRRSIREFKDVAVENDTLEKILETAKTAPMGLPPSDVNVLIMDTKEKVETFAGDFCDYLEEMRWFFSDWFLLLMRPLWGKSTDELFRGFLKPLFHAYTEQMKAGTNLVTYDAPAAFYFYGSPFCDPADPIVAATYAMIAAESLGLGSCMIGGVHPFIQNGRKAKKFRQKHGIKYKSREGLIVIVGYPRVKYRQGIRRTFASIEKMTL